MNETKMIRGQTRLVLLAMICVSLSAVAVADCSDCSTFGNINGTMTELTQDHAGYYLSVPNSTLNYVNGIQGFDCGSGLYPACVGVVHYQTGLTATLTQTLINNISGPPTQLGAGGSFGITEKMSGVGSLSFIGSFTSDTWTFVGTASQGVYQWSLTGSVSGTLTIKNTKGQIIDQMQITGATVQLTTAKLGTDPFTCPGGKISLSGGTTAFPVGVVPESGTLVLFGTGLIGVVLVARRKISARTRG